MIALGWQATTTLVERSGRRLVQAAAGLVGVTAVLGMAMALTMPRWKGFALVS